MPKIDINKIVCANCIVEEKRMMIPIMTREDGECVVWCKTCGTIATPHMGGPLETDDFCSPTATELRTGEDYLPFRRIPKDRTL